MKKQNLLKLYILMAAIAVASSCSKEFLDRVPYDAVPFDQAIETEADLDAAVNGIYSAMRDAGIYGRSLPIMNDIMADNVYIFEVNSNRYIPFNTYAIFENNGDVAGIWAVGYNSILRANQAINCDLTESAIVDQLRGEALAARACVYFDLVRTFGRPYSAANINLPGVPLILTYDPALKPERNTIGEVYTQIVADLNAAISLMTIEKNSQYFSVWGAKGLLAKVYQYMGDWENAKLNALDVINNGGYALVDSTNFLGYWSDPGATVKSETLFELSLDIAQSNGNNSLAAFYDDDVYGDAMCDSNFYNSYTNGDVRKLLMYTAVRNGQDVVWVNKFPNSTNGSDYDDMKIIRLAEIYLIAAEAYYNLGDEANAKIYLNTIAQIREPSFAGYTSSGTTLLDDITNERRKELAFEGNRFFDLNRLGLTITRGLQFPPDALIIPADDHRRILPIPLAEINANPNISQNPGY